MTKYLVLFSFGLVALSGTARADQIVNTLPTWNGTDAIGEFGYPDSSTYGEAVTAPGGTSTVTSFSLWLQEAPGFEFQSFISGWDNSGYALTGSLLYLSPVTTAVDGNLDEYTFNMNVPIIPGTIYMFGVTVNNVYAADASFAAGTMGGTFQLNGNSTNYFAWNNDGGNGSLLSANWNNNGCADNTGACGQAALLVDFDGSSSSVPEPGTWTLLASGLVLGAWRSRRSLMRR